MPQRKSHPSQSAIEDTRIPCACVPKISRPRSVKCAASHRTEMIWFGDSFNTRRNSCCNTDQLRKIVAATAVMKVGRIPCWPADKTAAQNPFSPRSPVRLNGRVRTISSATSSRTSPIHRTTLEPGRREVRSPVDSAPTDELVVTPAPAKVSLRSNFYYRRRRILSQISTAAPPAIASPSIASLGSISGAATGSE